MHREIDSIASNIRGKYFSLILFGSYSRGDYDVNSDIDIAQITDEKIKPYNSGKINISVYSANQLKEMAKKSSLFVYHLILEGKVIQGDKNILLDLKKLFVLSPNYSSYREEIKISANILDINYEEYRKDWKGFNSLGLYLFRSYLYAKMYDEGCISFSIKHISRLLNNERIITVFQNREVNDYQNFIELKSLFEYYAGSKFYNPHNNASKLLKNQKNTNKLLIALALHFLSTDIVSASY